ncbi:MAG: LCP family protein [Anaerolineae bacterium]|nr:LCP family protein [Anaerolineae bacterium]
MQAPNIPHRLIDAHSQKRLESATISPRSVNLGTLTMIRRFGCLGIVLRALIVLVGIGVIVVLTHFALTGINGLIQRAEQGRLAQAQATIFPGTATAIYLLNVTIVPTLEPSPTEATPTETFTPAPLSVSLTSLAVGATETEAAIRTLINPLVTPSPTASLTSTAAPTSTFTDTPAPTATSTDTETPIPPTDTTVPSLSAPPTNTEAASSSALTPVVTSAPSEEPTKEPTLEPTATNSPSPVPPSETPSPLPPSPTPVPPTETATATATQLTPSMNAPLPTNTRRPSRTPTPTEPATMTPTALAMLPTIGATSTLPRVPGRDACTDKPQPTAIPERAARLNPGEYDIMNILLIGSDADLDPTERSFRTDTMLIISINRTTNTVAMMSIPRDLFVCVPQLGMQRINVAFHWGESVGWSPNGGFGLLQETILYNLGIPIHFYARISFNGFKQVIDTLNGVSLAVDCPIQGPKWTGQVDASNSPIFEDFALKPGYYRLDGITALWYARMRTGTSDFDRNRRQQQILRAIWREAKDQGLLAKAPELWGQATQIVETNLQLSDIIGLLPVALNLRPESITQFTMVKGRETDSWTTPQNDAVQIPIPDGMRATLLNFYTPPTNRISEELGAIEIINASGTPDLDKVAVDTLGWKGFGAVSAAPVEITPKTVVYDYTGGAAPATLQLMLRALNVSASAVVSSPDPNAPTSFRVVLGSDYNPCSAPGFGTAVR